MVGPAQIGVGILQGAILGTLLVGLRRGNVAAVVNAAIAFLATLLPLVVALVLDPAGAAGVAFGTALPLWIAVAGFLHSLGMLGLYESTWWWDHLTHTISAALVAALVYAGLVVAAGWSTGAVAAATVAFTAAIGVCWELVELVAREVAETFDIEPVLVHYSWRDTAYDLGFDLVGALLVVLLDLRVFVPVAARFPGTAWLVIGGGTVALVSVLLLAGVGLGIGTVRQ